MNTTPARTNPIHSEGYMVIIMVDVVPSTRVYSFSFYFNQFDAPLALKVYTGE